jgi:ribosomal protein S18 acetylase RimI-like enzyme
LTTISIAAEINIELLDALARLMPQLSSASCPTPEELEAIIASQCATLFIARYPNEDGPIVGAACLATFRTLTGPHAWVEDVVVDESVRGQRIGEALTRAAIEHAASLGIKKIDLTSNPQRKSANRLYQRMGFQARQTNLYRYTVEE